MASAHYSPYAGTWYPDDAGELRELIDSAFESSRRRTGPYLAPRPAAFIVPHAGLMYSGTVAAGVYRQIRELRPRRIVLLGFSHRGGPAGVCIPDVETYETPLGDMRVDGETVARLLAHPLFRAVPEPLVCDHSVEIQLPLLQQAAPEAALIPLYVGPMPEADRRAAAQVLASLVTEGMLLVASSDFTHFGGAFGYEPFPADDDIARRLARLDREVIDAAGGLDASLFLETLRETGSTVCGYAPIALLLETLGRAGSEEFFQEHVDYQTSGEITGDYRHCVSYAAVAYHPASSYELAREEQDLLLGCARATLHRFLETGDRRPMPPRQVTPALTRRGGVFVTLLHGGRLRGCVGNPHGLEQLARSVAELTLSAALDDPRFPPLAPGDVNAESIQIEISVLSPMKRIRSRESFRLHEHGAQLENGGHCSLLLPQVTRERDWPAEKFWDALARKAGVGCGVYEDAATKLHVFRAQVMGPGPLAAAAT